MKTRRTKRGRNDEAINKLKANINSISTAIRDRGEEDEESTNAGGSSTRLKNPLEVEVENEDDRRPRRTTRNAEDEDGGRERVMRKG